MPSKCYVVGVLAVSTAIVACGSNVDAPAEGMSAAVTPVAPSSSPTPSSSAEPTASWDCDEFSPRYIGDGLTVSLPESAIGTAGESTADPGPVHAATSAEFTFDGFVAVVGRRIGSDIVPEQDLDQRVENGVVLFVKATDPDLRSCLLRSTHYDPLEDEQDE